MVRRDIAADKKPLGVNRGNEVVELTIMRSIGVTGGLNDASFGHIDLIPQAQDRKPKILWAAVPVYPAITAAHEPAPYIS